VSEVAAAPFASELADRAPAGLASAQAQLAELLGAEIGAGYPAGATLLVVDANGPLLRLYGGWACVVGGRIPTARDTIYDVASLTKVVATVTLSLALDGFPRDDLTLRQLLTHSSGLVPHREFFRMGRGVAEIQPLVFAEARDATPGPVDYSDLNYMLLGWALESVSARPLDELFAAEVAKPLGMAEACFRPRSELRPRIAATELDGDQRLEPGLVWGEVHDGNCWALGGVAGHAGLFATADDLGRFASALLASDPPVLRAPAELWRRQAGEPPDVRGLGWRLDAAEWGRWPETTIWHTGFTGTSLLIAPDAGVAVVLLMGGVHPLRRLDEQAALRTRIHRLVADAIL
jgi:CubicO group peptidase (beta-lactamase class C family)